MLPKLILSVFSLVRIIAILIINESPSYCTKLSKQKQRNEETESMQEESRGNMFMYVCVCV